MKIGLLLGSFDPIHIAHINMASCVLNSGLCDKILFVVAKQNPWKEKEPVGFELRCKMIEEAIKPFGNKCEVCKLEDTIEPPTYSYKVISLLLEQYKEDELFLICGSDTIDLVPQWRKFETHIKDKIGFIEIIRNSSTEIENDTKPFIVRSCFRETLTNKEIWIIRMQKMDASSTLVRAMIKNGMNPYPYVTENVFNIIQEYNLYK